MRHISIEKLDLSQRAKNALWRGGYATLGDLLDATDQELLYVPGIGRGTLLEIQALIAIYQNDGEEK